MGEENKGKTEAEDGTGEEKERKKKYDMLHVRLFPN